VSSYNNVFDFTLNRRRDGPQQFLSTAFRKSLGSISVAGACGCPYGKQQESKSALEHG
jgi:hypothetical protein